MSRDEIRDVVPPVPTISDPRKKHPRGHWPQNSHLRTHITYPNVYIVAVGDIAEGVRFYGPFSCAAVAWRWAVDNLKVGESVQIYPMSHVRGVRGEVEVKS